MRTVIFGGTGDVGQIIVDMLNGASQAVTVLTRQDKKSTEHIHFIPGNVLDYDAVENCINEGDQIIISLGFNNSALDTMSKGTRNILEAMAAKNCTRIICLSAQGAGDSWNYMPDEFKHMVMNDPILSASFHDHGIQEELVRNSKLEWTIVRPTEIVSEPAKGTFTINRPTEHSIFQISKYDVARFIVDELRGNRYTRQVVMITD